MTSTSEWPSAADYVAAVQDPEQCLLDERLREATFLENSMGIPIVRSGQTATVFPVRVWGNEAAVRFFTAPSDQALRYERLSAHLAASPNSLFVQSEWIPRAVAYGTGVFPAVLMPWVPGVTLSTFVDDAVEDGDSAILQRLAAAWAAQAVTLPQSRIIHADLQHGNIMIDDQLQIRLIDYDSTWVPGLSQSLSEVGHPNYQHPERSELHEVSATTDVFAAFLIYTSLRAVAADPTLWDKFHNGENLIFNQTDFVEAGRRGGAAWEALSRSPDPDVARLGETLLTMCRVRMSALPDLAQLLHRGIAAIDTTQVYVPDRAGRESGAEWWHVGDGADQEEIKPWTGATPWNRSKGSTSPTGATPDATAHAPHAAATAASPDPHAATAAAAPASTAAAAQTIAATDADVAGPPGHAVASSSHRARQLAIFVIVLSIAVACIALGIVLTR